MRSEVELKSESFFFTIKNDQYKFFPEIFEYFDKPHKRVSDIPNLVGQLNVFRDKIGILRVKCKLRYSESIATFPILMSNKSHLSRLIIRDLHHSLSHAGKYTVLSELRKTYWIPSIFSLVKKNPMGMYTMSSF